MLHLTKSLKFLVFISSFSVLIFISACGPSPWSKYVKEGHHGDLPGTKSGGLCSTSLQSQVNWIRGPVKGEESEFNLVFNTPLDFVPKVELFMPDMGHGSAPTHVTRVNDESFNVKNVYFIMYGTWELRLKKDGELLCVHQVEVTP